MKADKKIRLAGEKKVMRWTFILLFIIMGFTGLGQMPIFKRYYIADIPGLAWSADFYLTHTLHYLGAVFMLGIITYVIFDFFLATRRQYKLSFSAFIRIVILAGLVITGIFRVLKNLPHIVFSPDFTMFIDIFHLVFMMIYILAGIIFLILKTGWLEPKLN